MWLATARRLYKPDWANAASQIGIEMAPSAMWVPSTPVLPGVAPRLPQPERRGHGDHDRHRVSGDHRRLGGQPLPGLDRWARPRWP